MVKSVEEVSRKAGRKQSRCPGDDDDGFSCFNLVPSGKYRTAVLLKLGHDHFLVHPSHFITSYAPPCSVAHSLNRTCTHPGWRVAVTTRFCNAATIIHAASVRNCPHVNLLTPRIWRRLPDVWKMCAPPSTNYPQRRQIINTHKFQNSPRSSNSPPFTKPAVS